MDKNTKCCVNCKYLSQTFKNNRYNDIENFCIKTGYCVIGIDKDITKIKRYSPGGKELICEYTQK